MLYRLVRTYLTPVPAMLGVLLALQLVATLASLYLPSLNGRIIDEGVAKGDTDYILRDRHGDAGGSLVQIARRSAPPTSAPGPRPRSAATCARRSSAGSAQFSAQEVSRFGAPTLISRSTNDVPRCRRSPSCPARCMVSAPIMMVGGIFMALREDVGLSWLVAVAVPALGSSVGLVISRMVPQFRSMQVAVDWVNRVLREQITGIRVVRAFVREDIERERFAEANTAPTPARRSPSAG